MYLSGKTEPNQCQKPSHERIESEIIKTPVVVISIFVKATM